ncbi:MAG: hypothetical protein Q9190_001556 [Brigantiaea leucoxantha]
MHFITSLFVAATTVAGAIAQTSNRIAFTSTPSVVTAGSPTTIRWGGGDGSPVTIILERGEAEDLRFVDLVVGKKPHFSSSSSSSSLPRTTTTTTTNRAARTFLWGKKKTDELSFGNSYTWTPKKSLTNGDNYALKISQGIEPDNYSGMFSVTGGSGSSSPGGGSTSATVTSSSSSLPLTTQSAIAPTTNVTVTTAVVPKNATTATVPIGTGPVGTGASGVSGTGIPITRNQTLSRPTLSSTSSSSSSTAAATTTGGGGSGATTGTTGGGAAATPSSGAIVLDTAGLGSPLALIFTAIVALFYLG